MIRVELTEGEARALAGADVPESFIEGYPYWLLERAQVNIERAMRGEERVLDTDDTRPAPRPGAKRLVMFDPFRTSS